MKKNNCSIFFTSIVLLFTLLLNACANLRNPVYKRFNHELDHTAYRYFTYPWEASYVYKNPALVGPYPPNTRIGPRGVKPLCTANYPLPYTLTSPTSLFVKHLFGTC